MDIAIPANNKARHSIGVLYWLLARMVLQVGHRRVTAARSRVLCVRRPSTAPAAGPYGAAAGLVGRAGVECMWLLLSLLLDEALKGKACAVACSVCCRWGSHWS